MGNSQKSLAERIAFCTDNPGTCCVPPDPQQGDEFLFPSGTGRGLTETGEIFALAPSEYVKWSWPKKHKN